MNENKRIAINSAIIFLRLCIVTVIGLVTARWVLLALGASDFGLYNVVGGIVMILNIMGSSMTSSTYRFLAFEIGKGDNGNPRKVYNTSLLIHIAFAGLILFFGLTLGLWYVDNFLNVDPSRLGAARFVLLMSVTAAVFSAVRIPCDGLLVAYEKFHIAAITDVFSQFVKLALVYYLLRYDEDRLELYSVIMLFMTIFGWLLVVGYTVYKHRDVVKPHMYRDGQLTKEMLAFSGWILVGATAGMGKKQGSNMLINYFFGTIVNASYAIASQIENYILLFARTLNNAAIPQIIKNVSGGNTVRSIHLTSYISKYTYFMMLLVAFPLMMEIDFILELWLRDVPDGASEFCGLLVINGLIECLGEGTPALVQATGKLKQFTIVCSSIIIAGVPIGWFLFKLGLPETSILICFIVLDLIVVFVRLYLLKRVLDFDIHIFIQTSYLRVFYVSIPLVIIFSIYDPSSFMVWGHLLGILFSVVCVIGAIILLGIDNKERIMLKSVLQQIKNK